MRIRSKIQVLLGILTLYLALDHSGALAQNNRDIRAFGAIGDGKHNDTAAIQQALDSYASTGGGSLVIPPGTYLCGSIHLRSNCTLNIEAGAVIKGMRDRSAYDAPEHLSFKNASDEETTFFHHALLWGEDLTNVSIVGEGVIDANFTSRRGPKPIALKRCSHVLIRGITIKNAPNYNISLLGNDYVLIDGVTILNGYADGIDPDSCTNVIIANCHVESRDDAIVLKTSYSLGLHRACERVTITNCYLGTTCYCFKLGTESGSDFKQIAISNCVMGGFPDQGPASGGVAIESVDGAHISDVTAANLSMDGVRSPFYMRLGNRGRDLSKPVPGSIRGVNINNIVAQNASLVCTIAGIPAHSIEDVSLSHIAISFSGSGMLRPFGVPVPENEAAYPDDDMFGPLSADGLYIRHVRHCRVDHVQLGIQPSFWRLTVIDDRKVDWSKLPPSNTKPARPATEIVCDDVSDLTVEATDFWESGKYPALWLRDTHDLRLINCRVAEGASDFIALSGGQNTSIKLVSCETRAARNTADNSKNLNAIH